LLMKQTLESPYDPGALLLSGPNVKFTSADQFLSGSPRADGAKELTVEIDSGVRFGTIFEKHPGSKLRLKRKTFPFGEKSLTYDPGMSEEQMTQILEGVDADWSRSVAGEGVTAAFKKMFFGPGLTRLIHIPGLRGSPQRTYPITTTGPIFQGTFDSCTASVISHWQSHRSEQILDRLNHDLVNLWFNIESCGTSGQ